MLAVITLFAMIVVEDADAEQAVNHTGNTQPPDASLDYWTSRIEQDTTWRDTVYVGGDVTIASGATLTLAADTQVHFLSYHDDTQGGLDPTRAELIVEGRLHAQAEGIVFCSANAASLGADWYGIVIKRGGLADVSNATIRDGLRCLYAKMGGRVRMDHIAFANCGKPTAQSFSQRSAARNGTQVGASRTSGQLKLLVQPTQEEPVNSLRVEADNAVSGATLDSLAESRGNMSIGKRLALKLITGTFGAVMGIVIGDSYCGDGPDFVCGKHVFGYLAGTAIGVNALPGHHSIRSLFSSLGVSLGGSAAGLIGGWGLMLASPEELWPSLLVGPVVGAIWASEWWRKPPPARRFSIGLVPNPRGSWSAVATLRF